MSYEIVAAQITNDSLIHFGKGRIIESSVPPVLYCAGNALLQPGTKARTAELSNGLKVWEQDTVNLLPLELPIEEVGFDFNKNRPLKGCLIEQLLHVYAEQMGLEKSSKGLSSDRLFHPESSDLRRVLLFEPITL